MARYRVKAGHVLPHAGQVLPEFASVELPAAVAADHAVAFRIEPADDDAQVPELPAPVTTTNDPFGFGLPVPSEIVEPVSADEPQGEDA